MNLKNLILAIAFLIATVVVSITNTDCICCREYPHFLTCFFGITMIVIIIADWGSSLLKRCKQAKAQKEKEITELKQAHKIAIIELERKIESVNKHLENLKQQLSSYDHTKYDDLEGFFEWYKLKVLADKDYIFKSFSDALKDYEDFKKKLK